MNRRLTGTNQESSVRALAPGGVLQRKCALCGNHTMGGGKCEECDDKTRLLQRKSNGDSEPYEAPSIVGEALNSPGRPLDVETRAFFEPRFGHDFSDVRLHTGAKAAASAREVNATAYTVGNHIVFSDGASDIRTGPGQKLLAHELTHVAQQRATLSATGGDVSVSSPDEPSEREADAQADRVMAGYQADLSSSPSRAGLRRKVLNNVVEDFQSGAKACLVHIHGEERTALAVAKELRGRRCVNLMHLDTKDRPIDFEFTVDGFDFVGQADPNRIFTPAGRSGKEAILETHPKPGQKGVDKVAKNKIRAAAEAELQGFADGALIPSLSKCRAGSLEESTALPVLALHNNEGLSPAKFKDAASKSRSPNPATGDPTNPNDFFFVTKASDFDALKDKHNVVLQESPVQSKNDDGSLSVLLANQRYINIEKEGRRHDKLVGKPGGFQTHDKVYLRNYALAAEALDLLGVMNMPCGSSPDFERRTRSIFNRRLGQSGRQPTKLASDQPFLDREELPDPAPEGCALFKDQPAIDRRADEWRTRLDRIPLIDMIHWVLGGPSFTPAEPLAEFKAQRKCLIDTMTKSLKAKGKKLPAGDLVKSEQRSFAEQKKIWSNKFAFTSGPFDRISDFARAKCAPLLGTDVQWDPGKKDHKTCWSKLTDDEKQKEILMASSAPGISRHHAGVDFDFGQSEKDLDPQAWTGTGRFADAYSWLARNASAFGFIQPFDTKGGYGVGYMTERWHWSYYPVAQAALEFIMDHEAEVDAKLQELWSDGKGGIKPEFSFIAKNWKNYLFNVEQEGVF